MSGSYGVPAAVVARCTPQQQRAVATAAPPQWFAVQTRYRFEKSVVAQLSHKKCEVYLPLLTEHHRWSDRQKVVTVPLFPGYALNCRTDRLRELRGIDYGRAAEAD